LRLSPLFEACSSRRPRVQAFLKSSLFPPIPFRPSSGFFRVRLPPRVPLESFDPRVCRFPFDAFSLRMGVKGTFFCFPTRSYFSHAFYFPRDPGFIFLVSRALVCFPCSPPSPSPPEKEDSRFGDPSGVKSKTRRCCLNRSFYFSLLEFGSWSRFLVQRLFPPGWFGFSRPQVSFPIFFLTAWLITFQ